MDPIQTKQSDCAAMEQLLHLLEDNGRLEEKFQGKFLIIHFIQLFLCYSFLGILIYELFLNRSGTAESLIAVVLFGYFIVDISIIAVAAFSIDLCQHPRNNSKNFKRSIVLTVFLGILLLIFAILPHILNDEKSGNGALIEFHYAILATYICTPLSIIYLMIHTFYLNKHCKQIENFHPLIQKAGDLGILTPELSNFFLGI